MNSTLTPLTFFIHYRQYFVSFQSLFSRSDNFFSTNSFPFKPSSVLHVRYIEPFKAIPVRACGGLYGCDTSRLPHFLDNRLTDGGEVVSLMRRPPLTPKKIPGTDFY
jgi:hypothetical protein